MELEIKPHRKNIFPLSGILVKGRSVVQWVKEIHRLGLAAENIHLYPIPDTTANSVWGCLILTDETIQHLPISQYERCQLVASVLFIPEHSVVNPLLCNDEFQKIFSNNRHILHPEFGLVGLSEELDIRSLIVAPEEKTVTVRKPSLPHPFTTRIRSYRVQPLPAEEEFRKMQDTFSATPKKINNQPLSIGEKAKLFFYKFIFSKKKGDKEKIGPVEKTPVGKTLSKFFNSMFKGTDRISEKLQYDFEDLERRNQKAVDKLLDMLRDDPKEALKYAIPLDEAGASRDSGEPGKGLFTMSQRWFDFSWSGNQSFGSGGSVNLNDKYYELQRQYTQTAEQLIRNGMYHEAAFVYMKLLKNYIKAAETLELGGYFSEAASVYLHQCHLKQNAAHCYEKGNMTLQAIELYKELDQKEKVGDLYVKLNKPKEANVFYDHVVAEYEAKNQYVKASLICRDKMKETTRAQELLLTGWRNQRDAENCLNTYFGNFDDNNALKFAIKNTYESEVTQTNSEPFLDVMQKQFKDNQENRPMIREIAFEIVAKCIKANPAIALRLRNFNPQNTEFYKDALRFKLNRKKQ